MFEFSARIWRGAGVMIAVQPDLLGGQSELGGQDLADLVTCAQDADEQGELTTGDIPEKSAPLIKQ